MGGGFGRALKYIEDRQKGVAWPFVTWRAQYLTVSGAVAQLGERLNGIQEVVGSIPSGSTTLVNKYIN